MFFGRTRKQDKHKITRKNRRSFFESLEKREVFANSVSVTPAADRMYENAPGTNYFVFTRTGDVATTAITVNYSVAPNKAVRDQDYHDGAGALALDGTIVFPKDVASVSVPITGIDNAIGDGTRDIVVTGTSGTGYTWSATNTATISIDDNDVRLHVLNSQNVETGVAYFEVRLLTPGGAPISSNKEITFKYATQAVTATEGVDYVGTGAAGRSITLPAGTQSTNELPASSQIRINVPINSDTSVEADETFYVNILTNPAPTNVIVDDSRGVGTIRNDDTIASINSVTGSEGGADMVFTVTLANPSATNGVDVTYSITPVTAEPSIDYAIQSGVSSGTLHFAPNQTTATIAVIPINLGDNYEAPETFQVSLTSAVNAVISSSLGIGTGTIVDTDPKPVLSLSGATVDENAGTVSFTVTKTGATSVPAQFTAELIAGTAQVGTDFQLGTDFATAQSKPVFTLNPGETSKTISFPLVDDSLDEALESFSLKLTSAVDAAFTGGGSSLQAHASIGDNDLPPDVTVDQPTAIEGGILNFTLTLTAPSGQVVVVGYVTTTGTTEAGDLGPIGTSITFQPGETTKVVSIQTNADADFDDEQFGFTAMVSPGGVYAHAFPVIVDSDVKPVPVFTGSASAGQNQQYTLTLSGGHPDYPWKIFWGDELPGAQAQEVPAATTSVTHTYQKPGSYTIIGSVAGFSATAPAISVTQLPGVNLVVNGSFEEPAITPTYGWDLVSDDDMPGWTVTAGPNFPTQKNFEVQTSAIETPADGAQYLELDADTFGPNVTNSPGEQGQIAIASDSISVVRGQTYELSFLFKSRGTDLEDNQLLVSYTGGVGPDGIVKLGAGGTPALEGNAAGFRSSPAANGWTRFTGKVTAIDDTLILRFEDVGNADNTIGTLLDNVSLVPKSELTIEFQNKPEGEDGAFRFKRSGDLTAALNVPFEVRLGTATPNFGGGQYPDFDADEYGSTQFGQGSAYTPWVKVEQTNFDDSFFEPDESYLVNVDLEGFFTALGTGYVLNDDAQPLIDIDADTDNSGVMERDALEDDTEADEPGVIVANQAEQGVAQFVISIGGLAPTGNYRIRFDMATDVVLSGLPSEAHAGGELPWTFAIQPNANGDYSINGTFSVAASTGLVAAYLETTTSGLEWSTLSTDTFAYTAVQFGLTIGYANPSIPAPSPTHVPILPNMDDDNGNGTADSLDGANNVALVGEDDRVQVSVSATAIERRVLLIETIVPATLIPYESNIGNRLTLVSGSGNAYAMPSIGQGDSSSQWTEWGSDLISTEAEQVFVAKTLTRGGVMREIWRETVTFHRKTSLVVAIGGNLQIVSPSREAAGYDKEGVFQVAVGLRNAGYNVYLAPYEDTEVDTGEGRTYDEIVRQNQVLGITEFAFLGYSYGASDVHDIAARMASRPTDFSGSVELLMTFYVDGVDRSGLFGMSPEYGRPESSPIHYSYFRSAYSLQDTGSDWVHGARADADEGRYVDVLGEEWGENLGHTQIDDSIEVLMAMWNAVNDNVEIAHND